jgi:hypothetical protein
VFGGDHATWAAVAALLGGTLAATAHTAKATTRAAVNTSPEPFSNVGLSLAGDAAVPAACCGCRGRTRWPSSSCWRWRSLVAAARSSCVCSASCARLFARLRPRHPRR